VVCSWSVASHVAWYLARAIVVWKEIGYEGRQEGASERSDNLRVRGLAVGSSQLPWAHIKDAASHEPVKGQLSLGSGYVCSKAARNRFVQHVPRLGTAAPGAGPKPGAGGEDEPASGTDRRSTVARNARPRTGSIGPGALNASEQRQFRPAVSQRRNRSAHPVSSRARASAQPRNPDFFAAIVPGAKSISHALI
jgi:hypothetical protein